MHSPNATPTTKARYLSVKTAKIRTMCQNKIPMKSDDFGTKNVRRRGRKGRKKQVGGCLVLFHDVIRC